jgi:hypothetical protein
MKVNLTTGDVDLALINDFRPVANVNIPQQSALESVVEVPLFLPNGESEFEICVEDLCSTYYQSQLLEITLLENTTGLPKDTRLTRNGIPYATIYQDA